MRNDTTKLEKWYKQRYIKTTGKGNAENWGELQKRIHQGLKERYPHNPKKPTRATQYHQWGSKEEQEEMGKQQKRDKRYKQELQR